MDYLTSLYNLRNSVTKRENGKLSLLLANFSGTTQEKDIEKRTPVIDEFYRVKINVKSFSENEKENQGKRTVDFSKNEEVFGALREEFDMPYWAFTRMANIPLKDLSKTFIYQLKACNLNCPWCYVDDINKNGELGNNSRFFSIEQIVDAFEDERKKQPLHNFRPSGGEPTIAVEQWLEALSEMRKRGIEDKVYVQSDTNLTTGHFIDTLEEKGDIDKRTLNEIASYNNFGLLSSFKGTDTVSFWEATGGANPELHKEQFYSLNKLVKAGIDCYPFIYGPNPETIEDFMKKGARAFGEGFYLKTWILPLKLYGPAIERLKTHGKNPELYQERLDKNFAKSEEKLQKIIWDKYGVNYKSTPRPAIKLQSKLNQDE
ncbi:MAG: radical SAM protein [archaeon]